MGRQTLVVEPNLLDSMSLHELFASVLAIARTIAIVVVVLRGRAVVVVVRIAVQPLQTIHEAAHRGFVLVSRRAVSRGGAFSSQRRARPWISIEFGLHPRGQTRDEDGNVESETSRSVFNTFVSSEPAHLPGRSETDHEVYTYDMDIIFELGALPGSYGVPCAPANRRTGSSLSVGR